MGSISLQSPTVGLSNATEDPKIASDFTILQTVINGNLDDTNLASPNNTVRRVVLNSSAFVTGVIWTVSPGTDLMLTPAGAVASGTSGTTAAPLLAGDAGYSSQPQDFQVAGKTARARVRMTLVTNAVLPFIDITAGLYTLTGVAGTGNQLSYTFGAAIAGSTALQANPAASSALTVESAEFNLPSSTSACFLGFKASGGTGTLTSGAAMGMTLQLYAYNS